MPSKLFRDYAEAQLTGALAAAQQELETQLDMASTKVPDYSAGSGILKTARSQIERRAILIRDACRNAIGCNPGESHTEVLEFSQARLLAEYGQIEGAARQAWTTIQWRVRQPAMDLTSDLHSGMNVLVNAFAPPSAPPEPPPSAPPERQPRVDLFISHSSLDSELALLVVGLFRAALPLKPEQIRCTSVDGYRLPAGADTDDRLRREILEARLLVGIISSSSLESAYVLFELGARWGTGQCLVPLLAPGMRAANLSGPLAGLNALSCENQAQLQQLVADAAAFLGLIPERPHTYQVQLDAIITFTRSRSRRAPR